MLSEEKYMFQDIEKWENFLHRFKIEIDELKPPNTIALKESLKTIQMELKTFRYYLNMNFNSEHKYKVVEEVIEESYEEIKENIAQLKKEYKQLNIHTGQSSNQARISLEKITAKATNIKQHVKDLYKASVKECREGKVKHAFESTRSFIQDIDDYTYKKFTELSKDVSESAKSSFDKLTNYKK